MAERDFPLSSLARKALGGATATLFWQGTRIALLVFSLVVLARLLSPDDFGLIAMVTGLIGIGELLRDFGLSVASLQSKTLSPEEKSNLFWLNTVFGALLSIAAFAASWPIAHLYGDARLVGITQALSVTFLINGIATQFKAQINRDLRFVALGVTEAMPQAAGLGAAIALATTLHSYWALVVQALVTAVLGALLCIAVAGWRPGMYRRDVPIGRFVRFAGALVGTQGLAYLPKNVDSVLLGILGGPAQLGLYNRAYQVVVLPLNQVTAPLSRVAIPVLSRLHDSVQTFMQYLTAAQFATVTVTSTVYGVMIGMGDPLVGVVLGDQWVEAAPILQILAISGVFRALSQVPYWVFVTLGETRKQLYLYLVGQPLIVAAIAVGAFWGGGIGVAIGCSVGYGGFWVLNMWWARRVTGLPIGELALSGLTLVGVFGLPVTAAGATVSFLIDSDLQAIGVSCLATALWVAGVVYLVPRYRAEAVRFARLALERKSPKKRTESVTDVQ